jgi:hypothetical protein
MGMSSDRLAQMQLKNAFDKPYFRGCTIVPEVQGERATLKGYVPTKAHAVAATLAAFQIAQVRDVECHLEYMTAAAADQADGKTGPWGGELRAGAPQGDYERIDVISTVVRSGSEQKPGQSTLPAGAGGGLLDTFRISSTGSTSGTAGGFENAIRNDKANQDDLQKQQTVPEKGR